MAAKRFMTRSSGLACHRLACVRLGEGLPRLHYTCLNWVDWRRDREPGLVSPPASTGGALVTGTTKTLDDLLAIEGVVAAGDFAAVTRLAAEAAEIAGIYRRGRS